jgi:hypothetical protein
MTAFPRHDAVAAARSPEARALIDQAQAQDIVLASLTAADLCVLGGPRQALFDAEPAQAWAGMRRRGRKHGPALICQELERCGLLVRQAPAVPLAAPGADPEPGLAEYAFSPRLGLVMAARSRPTLAVICKLAMVPSRYPRFFGLGDEQDPLRAVVLETPQAAPPGDFPYLRKAGALGWFYRYDLVSRASAADFLARWALLRSERHPGAPRLVTLLWHDQDTLLEVQTLAVRTGDGKTARLGGTGPADGAEYDQAGLTQVMSGLFAPRP